MNGIITTTVCFSDMNLDGANSWVLIIAAIGLAVSQVVQMVLTYLRDKTGAKNLKENTDTTQEVNKKADTIVEQTNGTFDELRLIVASISDRVEKLETYNHETAHRQNNAIQNLHLDVARLVAIQSGKFSTPTTTETPKSEVPSGESWTKPR